MDGQKIARGFSKIGRTIIVIGAMSAVENILNGVQRKKQESISKEIASGKSLVYRTMFLMGLPVAVDSYGRKRKGGFGKK